MITPKEYFFRDRQPPLFQERTIDRPAEERGAFLDKPPADILQSINSRIEKHLCDPFFNVRKMLRIICMSRSDLHRKLKEAAGMSATEYIRYLRLRKAAELLLDEPGWSVYCIALEVGFRDHSYFTRRFREMFGICPGEFREKRDLRRMP
jgi:AraC-like DNA-binding protein